MSGTSKREDMAQGLYDQMGQFNPTATNEFDNFQFPFSPTQEMSTVDQGTALGGQNIARQGATNVAGAKKAAGKRALSAGYGGSALNQFVGDAGTGESANTTNALQKLMMDSLNSKIGVMNTGNQNSFQLAGAKENADLANINNMFKKFQSQGSMLDSFSNDTWFDDLLAGANTVSNFIPKGGGSMPSSGG
jgi:hypothetical protein